MRKFLITFSMAAALTSVPVFAAHSSDDVRAAQQALKDKGLDPGPVDGINGPKTKSAIRQFQDQQHIKADGQLGPQTMDGLGVKRADPGTKMKIAGSNIKHSYAKGGKEIGAGSKELGHDVKHGDVVDGAKDFGKGVGAGAVAIGKGTGKAAKNAAVGVKDAVTGKKKDTDK